MCLLFYLLNGVHFVLWISRFNLRRNKWSDFLCKRCWYSLWQQKGTWLIIKAHSRCFHYKSLKWSPSLILLLEQPLVKKYYCSIFWSEVWGAQVITGTCTSRRNTCLGSTSCPMSESWISCTLLVSRSSCNCPWFDERWHTQHSIGGQQQRQSSSFKSGRYTESIVRKQERS